MITTEKMTINLNVVELGNIDLLVNEGFYSNRTEFIKTAIRNQISQYNYEINQIVVNKGFYVGIHRVTRAELEDLLRKKEKLELKVVGMLVLDNDISFDLIERTISAMNIAGVIRCNEKLKKKLVG